MEERGREIERIEIDLKRMVDLFCFILPLYYVIQTPTTSGEALKNQSIAPVLCGRPGAEFPILAAGALRLHQAREESRPQTETHRSEERRN